MQFLDKTIDIRLLHAELAVNIVQLQESRLQPFHPSTAMV